MQSGRRLYHDDKCVILPGIVNTAANVTGSLMWRFTGQHGGRQLATQGVLVEILRALEMHP